MLRRSPAVAALALLGFVSCSDEPPPGWVVERHAVSAWEGFPRQTPEAEPMDFEPSLDPSVGLPRDGELVADEELFFDFPLIEVVPGSRVVAREPTGCSTSGFVAYLLITGDVEGVVGAYREQMRGTPNQIATLGLELREAQGEYAGDSTVSLRLSSAGGGDLYLDVIVGDDDEPSYARLWRCND
jgi:hypothetical protein